MPNVVTSFRLVEQMCCNLTGKNVKLKIIIFIWLNKILMNLLAPLNCYSIMAFVTIFFEIFEMICIIDSNHRYDIPFSSQKYTRYWKLRYLICVLFNHIHHIYDRSYNLPKCTCLRFNIFWHARELVFAKAFTSFHIAMRWKYVNQNMMVLNTNWIIYEHRLS